MIIPLFNRDVKNLLANPTQIYNNLIFSVLNSIIFIILLKHDININGFLALNLITLLFSNLLNIEYIITEDYQNKTLEQLILLGKKPLNIIITKLTFYTILSLINSLLSIIISALFFQITIITALQIFLRLVPPILLICSLYFLITLITIQLSNTNYNVNNNILAAIILFPLLIPTLILSNKLIVSLYVNNDLYLYQYFMNIIIALCLIFIPFIILLSTILLKDALHKN